MIWLATGGARPELQSAYRRLISRVHLTEGTSTVCLADDPDESATPVEEMISSLPLADRYLNPASASAKRLGAEQATSLVAVLFRNIEDAPTAAPVPEEPLLRYVGTFQFPFPEPGDFVSRDDHDWLGVSDAYVSGETDTLGEEDERDAG